MLQRIVFFLFLVALAACHKDIPEPETKDTSFSLIEAVQASSVKAAQEDAFFVKYQVKGSNVYIECIAKNVSFRNGGAKIILSVDGQKRSEYHQAAFIVKGLTAGEHHLKLELLKPNEQAASAIKEMDITIE